jgi:hypothetical protein
VFYLSMRGAMDSGILGRRTSIVSKPVSTSHGKAPTSHAVQTKPKTQRPRPQTAGLTDVQMAMRGAMDSGILERRTSIVSKPVSTIGLVGPGSLALIVLSLRTR